MIRKALFKPLNAGKNDEEDNIEEENLQHGTDIKILLSQYKRIYYIYLGADTYV